MKKLLSFFAALCCCFALEAQEISYEPITALPSPIDPNAVYVLGYQVGNDYYLHTSGTAAGQMQLSKNPGSPIEYKFTSMQIGTEIVIYSFANNYGSSASNYLHINTQGVSYGTFNPFSSTDPFSLSIVNGDISSASASGYTVCHDGDNIITVHTGTSEGNLRFFKSTSKPSYSIAVSASPAGTGTATATVGGGQVESAIEGTNITVTATPASGYTFVNWTENDVVVSTANPYTFTLEGDRNLVANFFKQYDFSADCSTGQTLYYRITDADWNWVSIVAPNGDDWHGWDGFTKPTGNITLPETVEYNGTNYTVTEINSNAFYNCNGLTGSLDIPNSVTSIGVSAFEECKGFTGSLTIGNAVESIGNSAFYECSNLTGSITIPNSVTSIGGNAFCGCSKFTGTLTIGSSVTSIGETAFQFCTNLTGSINIPNSVKSIGPLAFNDCSSFNGLLTISTSVTSIGERTFRNCSNLTGSLTIPDSVTSIGDEAFKSCYGFNGSLTIGSSVTSIEDKAFVDCSGFTGSLTIPDSVTSIGCEAFKGCYGFNGSLTIGSSVTSIEDKAFVDCSGFTGSLTIPDSVTSIGYEAFKGCSGFTDIIAKPSTPPSLGTNAFNMENLQTITAPCGMGATYGISWSEYGKMIEDGIVYELTVASANPVFGTAGITQQATCENKRATVTATPASGYKFVNWTENGEVISTANPYTFTLTTDCNLVANFVEPQYDFSAICETGQTLYYKITDAEKHWVSIVAPNNDSNILLCWENFTKPTGNITLPETVTHNAISYTVKAIGDCAFSQCTGLTGSLTIGNSVESIGMNAFYDCSGFTGSLTIGSSVTSIGGRAFEDCSGFTGSLTIGSSVESIGMSAFEGCSGFTGSLTIGSSVESIGMSAFENCSRFTGSLTIPNSVASIGGRAFAGCSRFTDIIFKSFTPPSLSTDALAYMNIETIIVPCARRDGYFSVLVSYGMDRNTAFQLLEEGFVYDLTVASSNTNFGSASITKQPDCGTKATVTATPASGYKFVNWTENGEEVSTANPYTFTLTTDRNLVANFVYIECVFRPGVYDMWSFWENWSNRHIPEPYDNITILGKCLLDVDATVSELRVAAGKTLTIGEGKTLTAVSIILENGAQLVNNGTVNCNAITLEDGARLVNNGTVTYNVMEITANQDPSHETDYYSTFYSSTNAHEVPDDVTAYTGVADGSVLTLTPVANGIIPAGEAVILRLTTNDNTAMTQQIQLTATTTTATKSTDNMLQGSDAAMTLPPNSYALSLGQKGVGFYKFDGVELPAHKAYLTYASGSAISLRFSFGDATDIDIIETEAPAKAYNLQGQQVDENYKGIVIVNGKKVLNN